MRQKRFWIALYAVVLLLSAFPARAEALGKGAYHPPALTIVVYGAPRDLTLQVEMEKEEERFPVSLEREDRVWESVFRLYREGAYRVTAWFGNDKDFAGAVLICSSGGEERRIPLTQDMLTPRGKEDSLTLYASSWTLRAGFPAWRAPLIFALRLLIVLLFKCFLFFLFDYRRLSSWLSLLGIELVVLGVLNAVVIHWINVDMGNAYPLYFIVLLLAFLIELLASVLLLSEQSRNKAISFSSAANSAGALLQLLLLSVLPV